MTTRTWVCGLLVLLGGCDGGNDLDAGVPRDAGRLDAGRLDAGQLDAGRLDAGRLDAGRLDASTADAAASDAGTIDAAIDAGEALDATADGAIEDAALADASDPIDAGPLGPTPRAGDLVIVEIQGNPQGAADEEAEYIELLNVSGRELDLMGVRLAHVDFEGGEHVASLGAHTIDESVIVAPDARVLLTRSNGGFFGGATRDYVYDGFIFSNGGARANRLRLMVPSWDGTEPPAAADVIDAVVTAVAAFDNPVRGRALQLDPAAAPSPSAASNDDPANWCSAAANDTLAYRTNNWGTPREPNRCD